MTQASTGDTVKVHYTGKFEDGSVFDSSRDREPLEFSIGKQQVIMGFEEAVTGMSRGESKNIRIPAEKAYGKHKDELIIKTKRSQMPANIEPEEGLHLQINQPSGAVFNVIVTEVSEDTVTLDGNHPLAGKDLIFDIEIVEVVKKNS